MTIGKHTITSANRTTFFGAFSKNVDLSLSWRILNEFERTPNPVICLFSSSSSSSVYAEKRSCEHNVWVESCKKLARRCCFVWLAVIVSSLLEFSERMSSNSLIRASNVDSLSNVAASLRQKKEI
jgi:hypothetical protein